jgi:hypothetical protein
VEIVDMRAEFQAGNNGIFSGRLVQLLSECVEQNRQAMLFLNRRGYSTFVSCRSCGYVVQCDNCDISMTYHKGENRLRCHFCGAVKPLPSKCPQCGKAFIKYFGIGTEQVEEQLHELFPNTVTLRMDTDTVRTKDSMQQMLGAFARGEAQFLVGTQMIAKGHDFPNVTLVGVVAADATLMIPDYRSTERTFQLLTQVAGRAGRDENPGRVVIQTYSPAHPAIRFAKTHDYKSFYHYELEQRKKAVFPPFSLFIRILFSGDDEAALQQSVTQYSSELQKALFDRLGANAEKDILLYSASPAPIKRKQGEYRFQILQVAAHGAFERRDPNDLYVCRRPQKRTFRHGRGEPTGYVMKKIKNKETLKKKRSQTEVAPDQAAENSSKTPSPEKKEEQKKTNWKLVGEILKGYNHYIVIATLCVLFSTAFAYAVPYVTSFTLDYVIQGIDKSTPAFLLPLLDSLGGRDYFISRLYLCGITLYLFTAMNGLFTYLRRLTLPTLPKAVERAARPALPHLKTCRTTTKSTRQRGSRPKMHVGRVHRTQVHSAAVRKFENAPDVRIRGSGSYQHVR